MHVQSGAVDGNEHAPLLGFVRDAQLTAGLWIGIPTAATQAVAASALLMSLPDVATDHERAVIAAILSRVSQHLFTDAPMTLHSRRDGVTFLIQHFRDGNLKLESVAAAVGCSKWHLSRTVKQRTGLTFLELMHAVRTLAAIWALTSSPDSVKEIAHRVGYSSTGELDRHFRSATGLSPTAFRKLLDWPLPH